MKNEDIQAGIGVKIQEKAYFQVEDFFEPFEDDEAAIEREVTEELRQWRKQVRGCPLGAVSVRCCDGCCGGVCTATIVSPTF